MNPLTRIDYFLDRITMYRLLLYILLAYLSLLLIFSLLGIISFSIQSIVLSAFIITGTGYISNKIFARILNVPTNLESTYLTSLILTLILTPALSLDGLFNLSLISLVATASKFLINYKGKHLFNPAAFGAVFALLILKEPASWWIGTSIIAPFTLIGGLLVIRKLRFSKLAISFFSTSVGLTIFLALISGNDPFQTLNQLAFSSPLIFMGTIMVTEPLTMPPTTSLRIIYASLIGFLTVPQISIFNFFFSPEFAILAGNIFSFVVSPKRKHLFELESKTKMSGNVWEFTFKKRENFSFIPGQYMEWTLPHKTPDSRGTRRFFTLASSPTEEKIKLGIKVEEQKSSFKRTLINFSGKILAGNLSGEFILPKEKSKKLAFVAGGIGITPFRSIIKYLVDKNEKRDIILLYTNKRESEISYKEIFDLAEEKLGIKVFYFLTDEETISQGLIAKKGRIDEGSIKELIPDYTNRTFYISGSHPLVEGMKRLLKRMRVKEIVTDYFPGLT